MNKFSTEVVRKSTITVDGADASLEQARNAYPDAIVRIGKHLYMNGVGLTVNAPAWESHFDKQPDAAAI